MRYFTKSISFSVSNNKLSGILFIPDSSETNLPSIVIYHGRGSSEKRYEDRAALLAEHGFLALVFDFRGCGESEGNFDEQTVGMGLEDELAGYDFLSRQEKVDKDHIGIIGNSFGGYHGSIVTSMRPVKSLALLAPAMYQDEWWSQTPEAVGKIHKDMYQEQENLENTKAIGAIRKYDGDFLLIEHEFDEILPQKLTSSYYENAVQAGLRKKLILKGASHGLYDEALRAESNRMTAEWFGETLG